MIAQFYLQIMLENFKIDGLMQEKRNSIAKALELPLFCINPWKCQAFCSRVYE